MLRHFLLLTCAVITGGCAENNPINGPLNNVGNKDFDLFEAAVRHVLPRAEREAGGKKAVVYVELPDAAPAAEFCRRFDGQRVPVRPLVADPKAGPGEAAYLVRFSSVSGENVQWEGTDQGRVFLLDYPAGQSLKCGTPYPMRLRNNGGRWEVVAD